MADYDTVKTMMQMIRRSMIFDEPGPMYHLRSSCRDPCFVTNIIFFHLRPFLSRETSSFSFTFIPDTTDCSNLLAGLGMKGIQNSHSRR